MLGILFGPIGCLIAVLLPKTEKPAARLPSGGFRPDPLEEYEMKQRAAAGPPPAPKHRLMPQQAPQRDDAEVPIYKPD